MEIYQNNLIYNHKTYTYVRDYPHFSMKHSHNTYEIIFFERGNAYYVIEGRKYKLQKNDIIFTRPYSYHYIEIQSNSEYSRFNVAFDDTFIEDAILKSIPLSVEVVHCSNLNIIAENFKRMEYYSQLFDKENFIKLLQGLLREILLNLAISSREIIDIPSEISPILSNALHYINDNLFTIKDLEDICNHLYISKTYFFKLFKNQLKISPKQYINLKRLIYANTLIQQGKKPSEVCFACGFNSYVGFYKRYVKIFGHSPTKQTD